MFAHVVGDAAHADCGEEVDCETSVGWVVFWEDASETGLEEGVGEFGY
jgi:hypothetical protein